MNVGDVAPDFELDSQFGTFTLSQFKGSKNVMLVFYPLDFTPTWSKEMPDIEKNIDAFKAEDTQVLSISVDSKYCHENWATSIGGISYPLLADFHPKGAVADKFGLYLSDNGITDRATVIIDKQGIVQYIHSVGVPGERKAEELLAECKKVNAGN